MHWFQPVEFTPAKHLAHCPYSNIFKVSFVMVISTAMALANQPTGRNLPQKLRPKALLSRSLEDGTLYTKVVQLVAPGLHAAFKVLSYDSQGLSAWPPELRY